MATATLIHTHSLGMSLAPTPPPEPPDRPQSAHLIETSAHEPVARPWELELLISGAVVFSLLQLPGLVDEYWLRARPHLAEQGWMILFLGYTYVKLILYTLIACFVTHLMGRAYWVGLIGLESVYPGGIRWDNSSYGPVVSEVFRERIGRLQNRIDAADRFCSILFPLAFALVMGFAYSILGLGIIAGLGWLISRVAVGGQHVDTVVKVVLGLFLCIPLVTWQVDRWFGERARPGGPLHAVLHRGARIAYYLNGMPMLGSVFMTLFTNTSKSIRYPVMYGAMTVLFAFFFTKDIFLREGIFTSSQSMYLPDEPGPYGVLPVYYEDQRGDGGVHDRAPSIQSDVITDPYVRLYVPYSPLRHGETFKQKCPDAEVLSRSGPRTRIAPPPSEARVRAVLACWAQVQPVTLDGAPLAVEWRFYTHPTTGVRGVVVYVPTARLAPGEHLIVVAPNPRADTPRNRRRAPLHPHYIRFWL